MQDITTIISTVGFPIASAIAIAWYAKYTNDNYRKDIKEMNELHKAETKEITEQRKEEMKAMTEAINNNTLVMTKWYERMESEGK